MGSIVAETATGSSGRRVAAGDERGLEVEGVLAGLDEQHVGAALREPGRLLGVRRHQLGEVDPARERQRLGRRTHRACDEARPRRVRRLGLGARAARQLSRAPVDLAAAVGEAVLGEHDRRGPEGVGLDDVGSRFEVAPVEVEHDVGPLQDERLVAAEEAFTAVVGGGEPARGERRPGGSIEHQDAPAQQLRERGRPRLRLRHPCSVNRRRSGYEEWGSKERQQGGGGAEEPKTAEEQRSRGAEEQRHHGRTRVVSSSSAPQHPCPSASVEPRNLRIFAT